MTGAAITKQRKGRATSLQVLPDAVLHHVVDVLVTENALGLWVLLAEVGVNGTVAMRGRLLAHGDLHQFQYRGRAWTLHPDDVGDVTVWLQHRQELLDYGSSEDGQALSRWLSGPITTAVRRRLRADGVAWAHLVTIGAEVLNRRAVDCARLAADGNNELLIELTGRSGIRADSGCGRCVSEVIDEINRAAVELADAIGRRLHDPATAPSTDHEQGAC